VCSWYLGLMWAEGVGVLLAFGVAGYFSGKQGRRKQFIANLLFGILGFYVLGRFVALIMIPAIWAGSYFESPHAMWIAHLSLSLVLGIWYAWSEDRDFTSRPLPKETSESPEKVK